MYRPKHMKRCEYCGRMFWPKSPTSKYCEGPHYAKCVVCGKKFEIKHPGDKSNNRTTCSRKCQSILRKQTEEKLYGSHEEAQRQIHDKMKQTSLERYGVEHPQQSDDVRQKTIQTNVERYGVETPLQLDRVRAAGYTPEIESQKRKQYERTMTDRYGSDWGKKLYCNMIQTYRDRTGYDHPSQDPEVQKKIETTNVERYGVKHPIQNCEISAKMSDTFHSRYGHGGPLHDVLISKRESTMKAKYGLDWKYVYSARAFESYKVKTGYDSPSANPEVKEKISAALRKYGNSEENLIRSMIDPSLVDQYMLFKEDPSSYVKSNFSDKPSLSEIANATGVSDTTIGYLVHQNHIEDLVRYRGNKYTEPENEFYEFLQSLDTSINIVRNTRQVITPKELDFYLPEKQIAFEIDPTATHNSSIDMFSDSVGISYHYHQIKTNMCETRGIFLFHVFGYEWTNKQFQVRSMIRNLLGYNRYKFFARKCEIRHISNAESRLFLDKYHRQGYTYAKVNLGLFYNDELVSLMTFGPRRSTIGSLDDNTWELVRFCSKADTNVIGGASKLFKHFIEHYNSRTIVSFSDRAHTRGTLYETLGFSEIRKSEPNYVWVDISTDRAYHRINAQKRNIKEFLHDPDIDLSKPETQIMIEHGFVQVFDCGTITWEWTK